MGQGEKIYCMAWLQASGLDSQVVWGGQIVSHLA